jgi:sterol desaturase/sphingolipid hydroxylase (fatty acid hydroxylase superfamily)
MFLEINFIWASHQVHHSAEDYNLSTALRQSIVQRYFSTVVIIGDQPNISLFYKFILMPPLSVSARVFSCSIISSTLNIFCSCPV